jgi:hypothetical protein
MHDSYAVARRFTVAATLSLLAALVLAAGAHALLVHRHASDYFQFAGAGCGSTSTASVSLPSRAFHVTIRRPETGTTFNDDQTGRPVAQITGAVVDHSSHRARWTATGGADTCDEPNLYAESGWETSAVYLRADYSEHVHTFFASQCRGGHYRPKTIMVACGDGNFYFTSMSWHGWNTRAARGRGVVHENDCDPFCAAGHFHAFPISVRLSRPQRCDDGLWSYTRLAWRYPGGRRPGDRNGSESWEWACHPSS